MLKAVLVPNVITYFAAISACEKGGEWQQALGLLAVTQTADLVPNIITYNAAISACAKGQQWQQALVFSMVMQQAVLHVERPS